MSRGPAIAGVIDLQGGLAVHAVAGQREHYRPIAVPGIAAPTPGALASAYIARGVELLYLADLDAIAGRSPAWEVYGELLDAGRRLWVDAGVTDAQRGVELAEFQAGARRLEAVIVGSESLTDSAALAALVARFGSQRVVFSLDLRDGIPLTAAPAWRDCTPLEIAGQAHRLGVRRLIVLDLVAVGVGAGVRVAPLLAELHASLPDVELASGGGVRGPEDVQHLGQLGCSTVLVATALLQGRLDVARP